MIRKRIVGKRERSSDRERGYVTGRPLETDRWSVSDLADASRPARVQPDQSEIGSGGAEAARAAGAGDRARLAAALSAETLLAEERPELQSLIR